MSFICKFKTSTITAFVKPCNVLNLAVWKVFYVQLYVESAFTIQGRPKNSLSVMCNLHRCSLLLLLLSLFSPMLPLMLSLVLVLLSLVLQQKGWMDVRWRPANDIFHIFSIYIQLFATSFFPLYKGFGLLKDIYHAKPCRVVPCYYTKVHRFKFDLK